MSEKLTPRQERFCQEYLIDLCGTQAAIRAGFSENGAGQQAEKLLKKTEIQGRIEQLQRKLEIRTEITQDYVLSGLKEVTERCMQRVPVLVFDKESKTYVQEENEKGEGMWKFEAQAALKGLELLGKHLGMFKDKVEITITEPLPMPPKPLQEMNNDELLAYRAEVAAYKARNGIRD